MRKSSLAAGAAAAAVAVLTAVPATAATPARDTQSTPMCATSQLTAKLGGGDAGAGNLYRYLVLTNHSSTACHLTGFPGVSLLDASGRQIGPAATRESDKWQSVVLGSGGSASDTIHTVNHQGTCLPASAKVRVYPPGNKASLVVAGAITNCHDLLAITPLAAGVNGNPLDATPVANTPTATPVPVGATPTPTPVGATPTPVPTGPGQQVKAVPSGAPDTGLAGNSGGGNGPAMGAAAAGVLALGAAGAAVALRRRSRARAQG